MSGGGMWQVPFKREGSALTYLSPFLSGVMFYQQPTTPTECGVRGHGRRSIYEVAYLPFVASPNIGLQPTARSAAAQVAR